MSVELNCAGCSRLIRAPEEQVGKTVRCPHCEAINFVPAPGDSVVQAELVTPAAPLGDDPAIRMLLPVGRSGWAIAAGYFGLFSVLCFPAPISVILGAIAMVHLRRNPKLHGMGRAIFGLVMGVLGCIPLLITLYSMFIERTR